MNQAGKTIETNYENLGAEAVRICQELIRIPSVNHGGGQGDERAVADYVISYLKECGLDPMRLESAPQRVSVVARIKGKDS